MEYLLNASGIIIILFSFYFLLLKNETFFTSIRTYFLLGLIITVTVPLVEIPIYVEAVSNTLNSISYKEITTTTSINETLFSWTELLMIIYLAGVLFFSLKFIFQLGSLTHFIASHPLTKKGDYYYIETSKNLSPFSFFNIIIYNKDEFSLNELEQIILHEKAHVIQWHSLDTILAHLLVIVLWFNPFVWLYKKAIQQNLEFLADAYALKQLNNQKSYQYTLLKTSSTNYCTAITNNFYNSLIKKRILMIHKNDSKQNNQFKYLLLIPILFAFVMTFNTKVVAQEKNDWALSFGFIIDKNSTDAKFKSISTLLKDDYNIDFSFKGIKRNSKNEITAIKINAKGEDLKAKFESAGSTPIKPINVTIDSDNNTVRIGNITENHQDARMYNEPTFSNQGNENSTGDNVFISSGGDTKTWTTSDGKTNTWTTDESENIVVIGYGKSSDSIKLNVDNTSENVFIVKKQVIGTNKKNTEESVFISSNLEKEPLFIMDGKEISKKEMEQINPDNIGSIEVLKDQNAKRVYGEKGSSGVILVTTKKTENKVKKQVSVNTNSKEQPLVLLNGEEISKEDMEKIDPDNIESVNVIKGESAEKKYGEKGANGVIEIVLKK